MGRPAPHPRPHPDPIPPDPLHPIENRKTAEQIQRETEVKKRQSINSNKILASQALTALPKIRVDESVETYVLRLSDQDRANYETFITHATAAERLEHPPPRNFEAKARLTPDWQSILEIISRKSDPTVKSDGDRRIDLSALVRSARERQADAPPTTSERASANDVLESNLRSQLISPEDVKGALSDPEAWTFYAKRAQLDSILTPSIARDLHARGYTTVVETLMLNPPHGTALTDIATAAIALTGSARAKKPTPHAAAFLRITQANATLGMEIYNRAQNRDHDDPRKGLEEVLSDYGVSREELEQVCK